eukprot:363630-Chlamydomonas_euryale.AAC.2
MNRALPAQSLRQSSQGQLLTPTLDLSTRTRLWGTLDLPLVCRPAHAGTACVAQICNVACSSRRDDTFQERMTCSQDRPTRKQHKSKSKTRATLRHRNIVPGSNMPILD